MVKAKTEGGKSARTASSPSRNGERDELALVIGKRLRLTREALALANKGPRTQKAFAKEAGILQTSYNQYESGTTLLTPESASKIYRRFGISLNWLYMGVVDDLPYNLRKMLEHANGGSAI